jgi:putative flippase GtrA
LFGVPLLIASTMGYVCGLVNSYLMNRRFTFRIGRARNRTEFTRFCLVNVISLGTNLLVLRMLVAVAVLPEHAQIVATGASFVVNFSGNRWWTFAAR